MKLGQKTTLVAMLILSCTLFMPITVQAKPSRTVINFNYNLDVSGFPEREWTSEDGIYHTINTPHEGKVDTSDSDFSGDLYYSGILILDLSTYIGRGGGLFVFTGQYLGEDAGFVGKLHFDFNGGYIIGKFNCHGTGSLQGLIKGTYEGWAGGIYTAQLIIWT